MAEKQLADWAQAIGGKPWGLDLGKPRIYMRSAKDRKVFFSFPDFPTGDDSNPLGGAKANVYIDDCGQAGAWYRSQREREMRRLYRGSLALDALDQGEPGLAGEIMDGGDIQAEALNAASKHLINGRIADARAELGMG